MELPSALFSLSPQNFSIKKFLIFFPKKSTLKKFLIFSQKSRQFSGNGNPEKVLIFQVVELCYISERYIRNPNIFRTLTYSELWHMQNPRHIQNTVKHLRWNVLQKQLPSALSYISRNGTLQPFCAQKTEKNPLETVLTFSGNVKTFLNSTISSSSYIKNMLR